MLNIRWIKNEAGRLVATWTPCASDELVAPLKFVPAHGRYEFHLSACHRLRKAA